MPPACGNPNLLSGLKAGNRAVCHQELYDVFVGIKAYRFLLAEDQCLNLQQSIGVVEYLADSDFQGVMSMIITRGCLSARGPDHADTSCLILFHKIYRCAGPA